MQSYLHPRDEILEAMERIYRYRMTTTSGGNLSIREPNGDVWITPARVAQLLKQAQPPGPQAWTRIPWASSLVQALERRAPRTAGTVAPAAGRSDRQRAASLAEAHLRLLAAWAPASVLLDPEDRIVHLAGPTERYLQLGSGEASWDLLRVAHPSLRPKLRGALFRARQTGQPVQVRGVPVELAGGRHAVDLHVCPAPWENAPR